jgi:hypothetical protein
MEEVMKMLLLATMANDSFNAATRDGTIGQKISRILEETKPEAAYFTENKGKRTALMIVNVDDPSKVPFFAEPWFLQFNADCEFHVVMTPADLKRAGIDELGKKWS